MKNFITKLFTTSLLIVSCVSSTVMADTKANISITNENNLSEIGISGTVINDSAAISSIKSNCTYIIPADIDSIIISDKAKDDKKDNTKKSNIVYDTVEWEETVKANIKIGENCINGDNGRKSFETATYIEKESSSSMFPVDAISYLMNNLSIEDVTTEPGKNEKSVTINYDGKKITYIADSDKVLIDNYATDIDNGAYSEMHDGKLFIPLRSLSNAIDCKIDWSGDEKTVTLKKTFNRKSVVKRTVTTETTTEETTARKTGYTLKSRVIVDRICGCNCPTSCYCKKSIGSCLCSACINGNSYFSCSCYSSNIGICY